MSRNAPQLIGNTLRAVAFLAENKSVTLDEVAIHLGVELEHARDVLFRARERGFVRKVPVTFAITPTGRKAVRATLEADPGSPEEELVGGP